MSSQRARKPASFGDTVRFGAEARHITRREEDDDDTERRTAPTEDIYIDIYTAYGEPTNIEAPEAQQQFMKDLTSARMRELVKAKRFTAKTGRDFSPVPLARQAAVLQAMDAATEAVPSEFSVNYLARVPDAVRHEFCATIDVQTVRAVLVPPLLVRSDRAKLHLAEEDWMRALADVGAKHKSSVTVTYPGHLRTLAPRPPADGGWYQRDVVESPHAHCVNNTTPMRKLTFQIETTAATTAEAMNPARRDEKDSGYYVMLMLHLVHEESTNCLHNVVCFRTFYFSRRR